TVTVINGSSDGTQTVNVGFDPIFLAVNPVTNKIYVSNDCGNDSTCSSLGTVTVIDGASDTTTTINVGLYCPSSQSCPAVKSTTSQGSRQSRSAITWLPCLTCFGSGSEPCFAGFGRAAV